jgi:hypothetical protein
MHIIKGAVHSCYCCYFCCDMAASSDLAYSAAVTPQLLPLPLLQAKMLHCGSVKADVHSLDNVGVVEFGQHFHLVHSGCFLLLTKAGGLNLLHHHYLAIRQAPSSAITAAAAAAAEHKCEAPLKTCHARLPAASLGADLLQMLLQMLLQCM